MILTKTYTRVKANDERAWVVSPSGKIIHCGQSHDWCVRNNPDIFGNARDVMELIPKGWIRVGNVGYYTIVDCDRMTAKQLDAVQGLVMNISHDKVEVQKKDRLFKMTRGEFLQLNSIGQINRTRGVGM